MKQFRFVYFFIFLLCCIAQVGFSATVTTTGSGNWSSVVPNAPWPGGTIPANGDDIIVGAGFTLTVDGNRTCNSLAFCGAGNTSGTISVNTGITLAVTNAVTLNSTAGASNACTIAGAGTINCTALNVGAGGILPGSNRTTIMTSSITTLTVSGNLTITSYESGGKTNNASLLFGSGTITVNGSVVTSNGAASNISTLNMNTGGGTGTLVLSNATPFSVSGTGTSAITLAGTSATVNYSGAAQTVYATTYYNLILSGSGAKTLTSVSTINGDFTLSGTSSATAATGITIGGHITLGSGTTFDEGGFTHYVGGNWINNGTTFIPGSGTIIFNVAGSNVISGTSSTTFGNMGVDGCTVTLDPGVTYNCSALALAPTSVATLTFSSGSVMNVTGNVTLGSGNGAVKGNIDMTNGGYLKCSTFSNWNGNFTYGTGTVEVTGTMVGFSPTGYVDWYNLIIASSANITFSSATVNFHGNLTMKSGSLTTSNPNYLNIYNDWTIETGATFVPGTGNQAYIVFVGGNTHHVYGDVTTYNIWANKTSNNPIIISGNVTVNHGIWWDGGIFSYTGSGQLTFVNGYVDLGHTPNATMCIAAPIKKIGDTPFTFPLCAGDGVNYNPLAISDPGTDITAYYTAQYFNTGFGSYSVTQTPSSIDHVSKKEYWTLEKSAAASNVTVQLFWSTASNSSITNCADLRIAHWNSGISAWENNNDAVTTTGTCSGAGTGNTITNAVVTSYSPFTFGSKAGTNPLPVELLSFEAKPNNNSVDVSWQTASEKNCDYFSVERSADGTSFAEVAQVKGAGNSSVLHSYASSDQDPFNGHSYYRLKQVDFNGSFFYSDIVQVEFNAGENVLNVYPSISSGDFTVSYSGKKDQEVLLSIRNILGQEFYQKEFILENEHFIQPLNLSGKLAPGVYFVTTSSDDRILEKKTVIK